MDIPPAVRLELIETLANVKGIQRVIWDALGQAIVVIVEVGRRDGAAIPFPVHMTPEVATALQHQLQQALAEKADAGWTAQ